MRNSSSAQQPRAASSLGNSSASSLQLTPLWEHILRKRRLPDSLCPRQMFNEFLERLKDPEWQVRQHALRVLVDVLVVMKSKADPYMGPLIGQLVENLGHQAPTVRKGALDCLRVYLAETARPDNTMLQILDIGLNQKITNEPFGGRLTCGVMLSLPALVQSTLHTPHRQYIIRLTIDMLIQKMGQVTHQEITLRVLRKMRDLLGESEFIKYMSHGAFREFDLLCSVYGITEDADSTPSSTSSNSRSNFAPGYDENFNTWRLIANGKPLQPANCWRSSEDEEMPSASAMEMRAAGVCANVAQPVLACPAKVIMETEIKINDDTLTMRILEAKDDDVCLVEPDVPCHKSRPSTCPTSLEDEVVCGRLASAKSLHERPPSLVKLLSDSDDTEDGRAAGEYYTMVTPSTPSRTPKRVTFGGEIVKMRTPDSDANSSTAANNGTGVDTQPPFSGEAANGHLQPPFVVQSPPPDMDASKTSILTLDIPNDNTKPLNLRPKSSAAGKSTPPPSSSQTPSPKSPAKSPTKSPTTSPKSPYSRLSISPVETIISPRAPHKAIEVLHNLQRDPSPNRALTARRASLRAEEMNIPGNISGGIQPTNQWGESPNPQNMQQQTPSPMAPKSWEELNIVDEETIFNLRSGNWRHRLQGVAQLEQALRSSDNLARVQPCLDTLLRTLLSSECRAEVAEEKRKLLINLITRLPLDNLEDRTMQIMSGLCRQGGAGANRVCKALMQRLPPSAIILKLISQEFLHAKSSRFREHALQMVIYALMTFPSTCFDTATCVTNATFAALNRKRRVRQAALDVLAVLGQITTTREVLEVVQQIANSRDEGAALVAAVKTRLSRKQLPLVAGDGAVQYSLHVPPTHAAANANDAGAKERSTAAAAKEENQSAAAAKKEGNGQQGPDIDWITAGIGSVSPSSLKRRAHRLRGSSQQSFRCLKTNSSGDGDNLLYRHSFRAPGELPAYPRIFETDDTIGYNFHHVFASSPYNYGPSIKKTTVDYSMYSTRRMVGNSCSDSSIDGRSSDSTYTSSGGSIVGTDVLNKGGGPNPGGGGDVNATNGSTAMAAGGDGISGRFTRQAVNSRFPAMDLNSTYRVHKPPTYYPGMGAYAHLQQQQYNMNATYPKVTYNLPSQRNYADTRRKSHQTTMPNHLSPPYYYISSNNNRAQHFNQRKQQKNIRDNTNNNNSSNMSSIIGNPDNCENQETFKTLENLQTKDGSNCANADNLDGTYTICMGSKLSATLHQQHQEQQQQHLQQQQHTTAANGRRFARSDKLANSSTKSSQTLNGNINPEPQPPQAADLPPPVLPEEVEPDQLSQKTPSGSLKSGTYSQKSTASAQSTNGSLVNEIIPTSIASAEVLSINETTSIKEEDAEEEAIVTSTPLTTVAETVNGSAESKELSETPTKWRSGDEVLQVEDMDEVDKMADLNIAEVNEEKTQNLLRHGSLASLHSKTESIKTQMEDTPPVLSRSQSSKSLVIEEEIEDNTSFVVVMEDTEDNEEAEQELKCGQLEETTEDSDYPALIGSADSEKPLSKPTSAANSRPCTSRPRSPTIEEIKALSRRNSMIKSMESLYERSPAKSECNDNTTETSSQSSAHLNSSTVSTILAPAPIKPQHTPLKQKSKTTHFLKSHRRISPVKQSIKMVQAELYPPTLQRFEKPREALLKAFDQLDSSNWEVIMVGLKNMVRLMRYHPDNLDVQMHMVCIQLTRSVRNLRSQVARAACQAATEMFALKTRFLEQECDDLVCALLHRTADTNRFLRADATRALESMCDNLSPGKILHILTTKGALHQNALVRTTTAKLLNRLVERLGCDKIYTMPREQRDKFFVTGANLLLEGSLETRSYAKSLFRLLSEHGNYHRMLLEIIPPRTYRNVEKTLKSIC